MKHKQTLLNESLILLSKVCYLMDSDFFTIGDEVPTKDSVQHWLRTKCHVDISVYRNGNGYFHPDTGKSVCYYKGLYVMDGEWNFLGLSTELEYEEAQETIINYALKQLNKKLMELINQPLYKKGDVVIYNNKERGIVKHDQEKGQDFVFVVYSCDDDWENFECYTAAHTKIIDLKLDEKK